MNLINYTSLLDQHTIKTFNIKLKLFSIPTFHNYSFPQLFLSFPKRKERSRKGIVEEELKNKVRTIIMPTNTMETTL
ncbi:hypothetical protein BpHYR1_032934 [Brachionus plicatilis]|uniref:Uncharacterized protein n=1 Tax=Brachionus plicatilis TaxID=10195 RepID=A0A3M7SW61_BRAPC|nr:hypothetical protein BpHYR1_032934 [Brachionus plicatilis]